MKSSPSISSVESLDISFTKWHQADRDFNIRNSSHRRRPRKRSDHYTNRRTHETSKTTPNEKLDLKRGQGTLRTHVARPRYKDEQTRPNTSQLVGLSIGRKLRNIPLLATHKHKYFEPWNKTRRNLRHRQIVTHTEPGRTFHRSRHESNSRQR